MQVAAARGDARPIPAGPLLGDAPLVQQRVSLNADLHWLLQYSQWPAHAVSSVGSTKPQARPSFRRLDALQTVVHSKGTLPPKKSEEVAERRVGKQYDAHEVRVTCISTCK
jgi:hypothetical protein